MRFRTILTSFLMTALFPLLAMAQSGATATEPATVATQPAATATSAAPGEPVDADPKVAGELQELLRVHPPEVGTILDLDPLLLGDPNFVGRHPELASFLGRHPEVVANPRIYLNNVHVGGVDRTTSGERMVERFLEGITIFSVILLFALTGIWLVRTIIHERRWSRLTRTQAEVHAKLLDRFTHNEDLLAYVQSPAGRRFLESAPIAVENEQGAVSAPIARMFWSIQVGIIVAAGAIGLLAASGQFEKEGSTALFALGTVALCVGLGFAISGVVSWMLSKRMGLLPQAPDTGRAGD